MSETRVCKQCGEEKSLTDFVKNEGGYRYVCKQCRNEYMRNREESIRKGVYSLHARFDDILARWVSTHAKKPNSGRPRTIRAYTCAGMRSREGGEFDEGELLVIIGKEVDLYCEPLYGNPTLSIGYPNVLP